MTDVPLSINDPPSAVVALRWYDGSRGHAAADLPVLVIAKANGRVQLMRPVAARLCALLAV